MALLFKIVFMSKQSTIELSHFLYFVYNWDCLSISSIKQAKIQKIWYYHHNYGVNNFSSILIQFGFASTSLKLKNRSWQNRQLKLRIRQLKHLRYNVKTAKSSYPNKMSFPSRNCNLHKQMYDNQTNPTFLSMINKKVSKF